VCCKNANVKQNRNRSHLPFCPTKQQKSNFSRKLFFFFCEKSNLFKVAQ
jgi:hypothetical protein